MPVTGFFHTAVVVSDLEASLRFYRDILGFGVVSTRRIDAPYIFEMVGTQAAAITVAFLAIPGSDAQLELLDYEGADQKEHDASPTDPGIGHFCVLVDDLEELFGRLVAAGFAARSPAPVPVPVGPNAGGKLLYALDPDGHCIELLERPRPA
jgi:catechol 2,3-dioxygenase-like lactoylglutathione lyase family enzyme